MKVGLHGHCPFSSHVIPYEPYLSQLHAEKIKKLVNYRVDLIQP